MKKQLYLFGSTLFVVATLVGVLGGMVSANSNPKVYDRWKSGNAAEECKQLGEFKYSYKIDSAPKNGTYEVSGNTITISDATKKVFDWAATDPITSVIVKAGRGANVWNYNPQAYSDTGLYGYKNKEISHVTFCWNDKVEIEKEYLFQFAKEWEGDVIDLDAVEVTFMIGDKEWQIGDPAVPVEPGDVLEPLSEKVTGLPANCSYESDLPESYTVFEEEVVMDEVSRVVEETVAVPKVTTDTLTATNTVTCEDEDTPPVVVVTPPAVLADTDEPQVAVTPVGAADAGGAGTTALVGLVGSTLAVSLGAVIRRFSL